jgi:glycosyltransferase involved in cell wall biosynthesis
MATAALAKELAEREWEVHVIVTCRKNAVPEELVGKVHVYRLSTIGIPYTRTIQRLVQIISLAHRIRPDLVQGQAASCGCFAAVVGRRLKIPSVAYIQGMDVIESGPIRKFLEVRTAVRYATRTIAAADKLVTRISPYARRTVDTMPHGYRPEPISAEVANVAKTRMGTSRPQLLFVGYLEPDKGVAYLLSAVATLTKNWRGLTLHVVGDGPLRQTLESQATCEGSAAHVTFHGALPHEEVLAMMRVADLFVLPSVLEPFGIVLVEALNEGCPVVTTTECGSSSIINQKGGGLVVPPGDAEALAGAIRSILADPVLRTQLKQSARAAGESYRWDRNVLRFERLYREVLAEGQ